jgi:hypothetical protein
MSIIVQQDATIYSLLYICKLLYMFRLVTPLTIRNTYNCIYRIWHWSNVSATFRYGGDVGNAQTVWPVPDAVITVIYASDDGRSYHPKYVEQYTEI